MRLDRVERLERIRAREEADADKEIYCRHETEDSYAAHLLDQARASLSYLIRYGGNISDGASSLSEPQLDQLEAVYMCLYQVARMIRKWRPYGYLDRDDYNQRQWHYWRRDNLPNDGDD